MEKIIRDFEIWLADFPFREHNGKSKIRPVLVLKGRFLLIETAQITSHSPRSEFIGDYEIKNLLPTGLDKQSTIRLNQIEKLNKNLFLHKLGKLADEDIKEINKLLLELNEDIEDVVLTDNTLSIEEPTEVQKNNGIADMLNNLIKSEFDAISDYNNAISTIIAEDPESPMIKVFEDILKEENIHVGQLQTALQQVSPAADEIDKGVEEAEEQLGE